MASADNFESGATESATRVLGTLAQSSRSGIVIESESRTVLLVNDRYCSMFGVVRLPGSFRGQDRSALEFVTRKAFADPTEFLARKDEIARTRRVVIGEELSLLDGRVLLQDYRPVVGADGEGVVGHVWEYHDVTDSRRTESTLRDAQSQLRQAQKLEAVGRLAASVAHDFNNLLMVVIGYSGSLLAHPNDEKIVLRAANQISKTADRAAALTRHLLAFSRKQKLQPQILDPNALIQDLDRVLRCLVREDISIVHVLQPGLAAVEADPGQLETMLVNLVVNACDAMPEGGKIFIETSDIELDESYAGSHAGVQQGPHVRISVTDTGTGMDEETKQQIFEPFFTTKEDKGTGLGLSTVYGIVKQSRGNIWVYSELGLGTAFKIYLPRAVAPDVQDAVPLPPIDDDTKTRTLLLVEDDEALRELLHDELNREGFSVLAASRPGHALAIADERGRRIDLMITDVVMPQMSGPELAKRITELHGETKVLFMSGYSQEALVNRGALDEKSNFLEKPVSPQIVAQTVRQILAGDTSRRRGRPRRGGRRRPRPSP